MHIHIERSGGFAGMRITASLNTDSLSPEEAHPIQDMIAAARFFDLPDRIPTGANVADQFYYRLTVQDETRQHTVQVSEASIPSELGPLLEHLMMLARTRRDNPSQ